MMIAFSVLSFASLSVATLAWFTANSTATFSTTQMTVDAGLQYRLYVYRSGGSSLYETEPTLGENPSFSDYFASTESIAAVDDWRPGQKITYAIEVFNYLGEGSLYLSLSSFYSPFVSGSPGRVILDSTKTVGNMTKIQMAWAINIYSYAYAAKDSFATFFGEQKKLLAGESSTLSDCMDIATGTTVADDEESPDSAGTIASGAVSEGSITFFYTLMFDDSASTHFAEVDSAGNPLQAYVSGGTRYFSRDTTTYSKITPAIMDSNCYSGMHFHVSGLSVSMTDPDA